MHLNIALCYLKTNKNVEARHECDSVLEKDPNNEKALFRRGQVSSLYQFVLCSENVLEYPGRRTWRISLFCSESLEKHRNLNKMNV